MQIVVAKQGEREGWIDVAKAIGIILVVWAHALPKDNFIWGYINQFHMPLFYFLSGYLYTCKGTGNLAIYSIQTDNVVSNFY